MSEYVPALRFPQLTTVYDRVMRVAMREQLFRNRFLGGLQVPADARVLDMGCGTGSTAIALKQLVPSAVVVGLDPDQAALRIAKRKADALGTHIDWRLANCTSIPFTSESFDVIVSTLMFHHLATPDKAKAIAESNRLLRPSGRLYVLDWGKPRNLFLRAGFFAVRLLDGLENTRDHVNGTFFPLLSSDFSDTRTDGVVNTVFGTLEMWSATK